MMIILVAFTFGLISTTHIITASSTIDMAVDLEKAETKDTKKLEIIKEIRRMNNDGSFIVGYEAADGTFKFESRDVLGNIKGTYGYVDENGEIKRVSYTTNNNTTNEFKNNTKRSDSTIRRPYKSGSTPSIELSSSDLIQTIPKSRTLLASQAPSKHQYSIGFEQTEANKLRKSEPTTTIVYATSIRSSHKPSSTTTTKPLLRSNKIEISDRFSKVLKMNKNVKAQSDSNEDRTERKFVRGNALRRQLPNTDHNENFGINSQILYSQSSDEDSVHTYSGITGTQRPIFSTTSSPRIPALVLAARSRAAMLRNVAGQTTSTTEKVYSKPPRRKSEIGSNFENEYLTQSPIAVQIPANNNQQDNIQIQRTPNSFTPKTREYIHPSQSPTGLEINYNPKKFKLPMQINFVQNDEESSESSAKDMTTSTPESNDVNAATQPILQSLLPRLYESNQNLRNDYDQRIQQPQNLMPLHMQAFLQGGPVRPTSYPNYFDKPLTARDFERLLNLLIFRHQQYQRINYLSGQHFYGGAYNGYGNPFGGYNPIHYHQGMYNQFDPRYTAFSRSLPPVPPPQSFYAPYSEQENMYQAQNPIGQYFGNIKSMRNYNNKPYGITYDRTEANDIQRQKLNVQEHVEYLPSDVREDLLYRMLMLAIQPDISASVPVPTTIPNAASLSTETISKKPVRSLQILGEE